MASTYFFNGRLYSTPTAMTAVDDTAMAATSPRVGNTICYVGQSDGGSAPGVLMSFASPDDAIAQLRNGPLLTAVVKAFAPSPQVDSPSTIYAMRPGSPTPSTLVLKDASANSVITLSSNTYGTPANRIRVQILPGTSKGLLFDVQDGANPILAQDNIYRNAMTVTYSGTAASATMSITNGAITLNTGGSVAATIDLSQQQTVAQVCGAISAVSGFSAVAIAGSENTPAFNGLDSLTTQDVKSAPYTVTANLQAVVDYINGNGQPLLNATRTAGAGAPPAQIGWQVMTGGTYSTPQVIDWTNAFSALQSADVQMIVPLTGNQAIWTALDAHCQFMSTSGKKERRAMGGPEVGTTLSQVLAMPLAIDSDRFSIVWPGHYNPDIFTGNRTLYAPYMTAGIVAAGITAAGPGEAMTNKLISVQGLEVNVRNPTDTDVLIQAGVLVVEADPDGYRVVRSISTWLANSNFNRVEVSCGVATDYVTRALRQALQPIVGARGSPLTLARAKAAAIAVLNACAVPVPLGPGVIVGDANSPAWKNLTLSLSADVLAVAVQCSPVIPVNFIPIAISIVPYSGTVSATSSVAA